MTIVDTRPRPSGSALAAAPGVLDRSEWETDALCRDLSTELFFSDDVDEIGDAKRICLSCPVRTRCLDAAVERGEQFGIWGGHLFVSGRIVLHKRRRGRPPKVERPGDRFPEVEVPEPYRRLVRAGAPG
ncbi:MAG: WhiB family transcriptional regulator [Acidimicrobiia bacterium]|nr:WhiB family transcriptional regulator [Microthrixaceae bacterium]MCO5305613.1 WhiB family transcriptional regulator [Microthrixaceae bacterium]RTL09403.1 MAG: WhiB family transcriptional regulator [Acidimicrobiia bacterium]HPG14310.1 WhiB family transcriptional regulator [Microthrixaceae bacterium]